MNSAVNVKGLSELYALLQQVPVKIERNVTRGMLRAGMKPIQEEAKSNARVLSGELRDGLKISTSAKGGTVYAKLTTTGPHGFVAKFLEFGTKAHWILAKADGALAIGDYFAKSVHHPGITPKPFMRPALDARAQDAVIAAGNYAKVRLATKEGLDTSEIIVEGDE
jgi:HK97 gp10 family phage protein